MAYWYDNTNLLEQEEKGYAKFKATSKLKNIVIKKDFDKQKRLVYFVEFNFRISKAVLINMVKNSRFSEQMKQEAYDKLEAYGDPPERFFKAMIQYDHDFPGRNSENLFGGAIKVYPMTKHDCSFHHLLMDSTCGRKYMCQVLSRTIAEVNSENTLGSIQRFCEVYELWVITGLDIDK